MTTKPNPIIQIIQGNKLPGPTDKNIEHDEMTNDNDENDNDSGDIHHCWIA